MNDTNNKSSALFTPSGCLTGDALMLFVAGSLTDSDLELAQQHISECPLCSDAADGLKMWLKEQTPDQQNSRTSSVSSQSETSVVSGKSHFEKGNNRKSSASAAYKFHSRTEAINERVKQRVNFHKQVEAVLHKRRQIKPYAWIGAAATVVLFLSIFYILRVQNLFDKQELARKNILMEKEQSAIIENSDSISQSSSNLALNVNSPQAEKKAKTILPTIVEDSDEFSADMEIRNDNLVLPYNGPEENSFPVVAAKTETAHPGYDENSDTSGLYNMKEPTTVSGVVVVGLGISREKKSLGYSTQDMKNGEAVTTREVKGIKSRTLDDLKTEEIDATLFTIVEQMPEFPGGQDKMLDFISDNLKYPDSAKESGIQGTVYISFVVRKDGRISEVKVLRSIGGGCDEEAMRVVKKMPRWKPATQRGKKVDVVFNLPVVFKLD